MITLIAAVDSQMGIGFNKSIPWHNKEDLQMFNRETIGGSVIMGKDTWHSLPKNLHNRNNIIVSSTMLSYAPYNSSITVTKDIDSAITEAKKTTTRIYGIGGFCIYSAMLSVADRILLTQIEGIYECDTFFPAFDKSEWLLRESKINNLLVHEYLRKELK